GPHVARLGPLAKKAGAVVLVLPAATANMRATLEQGLCWIEETYRPEPNDAWLLIPADHPSLDAEVVQAIVNAYRNQSNCSIAIPTFQGKRGHPAVIAWKHVSSLRAFPSDQGVNGYLRQHVGETLEVPVQSDSILIDLDTPQDYERMQKRFSS